MTQPTPTADCWFLTGATASGKTGVAISLARKINAEIVSLDSVALYRNMNIGTAKPTTEEMGGVPHHLIDVIWPHEEFSLAQYIEAAEKCVEKIKARGKEVLFVGGTPLYLKGLLRGIFNGPPPDAEFRRRFEAEAQADGPAVLHERLSQVDAEAAGRLHPNDTRRVIRALEVFDKTGTPISKLQKQFDIGRDAQQCRVFVLDWPREELFARIDLRVEQMFAAGLVDEVRGLLDASRPLSKTAAQAVGYRELIEHIQGEHDLAETIELVKTHTRQLAKRQCTWFRSLSECRILPVSGEIAAPEVIARILSQKKGSGLVSKKES